MDIHLFILCLCACKLLNKRAHLYTGNPNTHCSYDLQMFQDEFLQFSDAATLNEKQSVSSSCISSCGSVAVSLQTNVMCMALILLLLLLSHHTVSVLTYRDVTELQIRPPVLKTQPHWRSQHPSSSHLHLVDVGGVCPAPTKLCRSLTATVRHLPAICIIGGDPDALLPVSWTVAPTALELTGETEENKHSNI